MRTIEKAETSVAHEETLQKLKDVVEDAKALLTKQCTKSYLSQVMASKAVANEFNDINELLCSHMQALNLSVSVLDSVERRSAGESDAREDLKEMQQEVRNMMQDNQDDLRKQIAEMDAGQQGTAQALLSTISEGHEILRRDISDDIKNLIADMAPAQSADTSLPHVDMSTDLRSLKDGETESDVLGAGGFGEVRRMRWMPGSGIEVAVKVLLQRKPSPKALAELRKEAEAMHAMRHPNVIQLYGASLRPPHVCLVLEFAPHGSLEDMLEREGAPTTAKQWRERLTFASEIARGLLYLHSRRVLHLDIKSGNVLLFDGRTQRLAKLADFGLAFIKNESTARGTVATKTSAGTVNWKPPELFRKGGEATQASEIYSYACVLYELASGKIPWEDEGPGQVVGMVIMGDRPDKPSGCIEGFWDLVQLGWAPEPSKRVALVDALSAIDALLQQNASHDDTAVKKEAEAEAEKKQAEEEAKNKQAEEEAKKKQAEEEAAKKRAEEEEAAVKTPPVEASETIVIKANEPGKAGGFDMPKHAQAMTVKKSQEEVDARENIISASDVEVLKSLRTRDSYLEKIWERGEDSPHSWITKTRSWLIPAVKRKDANGKSHERTKLLKILSIAGELNFAYSVGFGRGRLVSLRLNDARFDAETVSRVPDFPPEMWRAEQLQELRLGGQLISTLPPEVGKLSALKHLDLKMNRLESLPTEIGQLSGLTHLDLGSNKLESMPSVIAQLSVLTNLDLSHNPIWSMPSVIAQLSALPALTVLSLAGSAQFFVPLEIGALSSLTQLDLSNNLLSMPLPPEIGTLSALKELDLSDNQLQSEHLPAELFTLSALTELDLEGNKLESLPPEIGKLSALTTLKVGGNVLQSLPSELRLLRQLTLIDFENNPVTTLPESIDELLLARLAVFPAAAKKKSAECCVVS